jgi:hypothetical protein
VERATRIEPVSKAWEARNKNLKTLELAAPNRFAEALDWKIDGKWNWEAYSQRAPASRIVRELQLSQ